MGKNMRGAIKDIKERGIQGNTHAEYIEEAIGLLS